MAKKAKKITKILKLQIPAARATMGPPIGPAFGQAGVNGQQFVLQFNESTKNMVGDIIPVVITIYDDRTFTFVTKTPPAAELLKKAAGIEKGAADPNKTKVATVKRQKIREIAERKLPDLNAYTVEAGMKIIEGSAKNMGIEVVD